MRGGGMLFAVQDKRAPLQVLSEGAEGLFWCATPPPPACVANKRKKGAARKDCCRSRGQSWKTGGAPARQAPLPPPCLRP
ncbi:hypothetical protein B296_00057351 [Ensete ventricosum]|uniref:Uncharacterized protein n=1 Tax=Ensete ventricosum TaxID=4639 RepID=A0A426XDN9_ENSVE|nr:hypothetical protein B296_00057351 [Ensete ventricosum]